MKVIFLYSLITMLSLSSRYMAAAQTGAIAKMTTEKQFLFTPSDVIVVSFNAIANNDRILLNWTLDKNQAVDMIEVERSKDEKSFVMAGLVFGTDQPDKVNYAFYEKNKGAKFYYRLRIINKDKSIMYSTTISPEPGIAAKH